MSNSLWLVSIITAVIFLSVQECDCVDIIGGHNVKSHSRPYMASIQFNNKHICGGALIEPQWVLTAAHCKINTTMEGMKVVLGAHSLSNQEKEKQIFKVISQHPNYNWSTERNDIMLLKLQHKAILNKSVMTVKLPKATKDLKPGTKCSVAGWGVTGATKSRSDTLKEANVTVMKKKICEKMYSRRLKDMICAGDKNHKQDACSGDSGGPLMCKMNRFSREKVYSGIVSFGKRCDGYTEPSVYTQLSNKYLSWIKETVEN
ncbi:granzyme K-like isoform X1 [Heptranchias perlo]|uniref:granzyme K-like isoform X1 n=1 Tax=Heptranchias perlo TaxID=212740 RepID=UPI00355989E2